MRNLKEKTKKQIYYDAFYEGVCLILEDQLRCSSGINIFDLPVDHDELREYADRNGHFNIVEEMDDA